MHCCSETNVVLWTFLWSLHGFCAGACLLAWFHWKKYEHHFAIQLFVATEHFVHVTLYLPSLRPFFHQVKFAKSQLPVRRENWWNKYATNRHVGMEVSQWNSSLSVLHHFNHLYVKLLKFSWNTKHFSGLTANLYVVVYFWILNTLLCCVSNCNEPLSYSLMLRRICHDPVFCWFSLRF